MGSRIQCFMLEPTEQAELSLRRYSKDAAAAEHITPNACSLNPGRWSYHNASTGCLELRPFPFDNTDGRGGFGDASRDDPRWPKACACGYVFKDADHWQDNLKRLWRRGDNGELCTTETAPAGAMWFLDWTDSSWKGPDGHTLHIKLPPGGPHDVWIPDARARNSQSPWSRRGSAPLFVCSPSIASGEPGTPGYYHGFLGGADGQSPGWLVEC